MKFNSKSEKGNLCRLCGNTASYLFNLKVLNKYMVDYFRCSYCNSLQTEIPYWIDEAYSNNLSSLDTGAAQRNINNMVASYIVCKVFGIRDVIDFGGGDGLLCRLLRDYKINCYLSDKYATPAYAQGYTEPNFTVPEMILSFEVFEHFIKPKYELDRFFDKRPKVVLATTCIYKKQNADWWYLVPNNGQHVFFYSYPALKLVAITNDYNLLVVGNYILFIDSKFSTIFKKVIVNLLLNKLAIRLGRALINLIPARGVMFDHEIQKKNSSY